ncbi:hypothetical protein FNV43_RR00485 [Rhamnella rubrinervis]|uniref:Uncharacterized protein n=1 Tax=Rhamnella rubrinervis TaxID=2594499 RepID=A0A8K0MS23_9ROSA|nr:hypothetical protein FNV43_RR00485 [Rhamnella rubrinervis]
MSRQEWWFTRKSKVKSRIRQGTDWRAQHGRDTPVEEPIIIRVVIPMRESSSSGSYIGRRSHRGSIPSTFGGGYRDIGLDDDSAKSTCESISVFGGLTIPLLALYGCKQA